MRSVLVNFIILWSCGNCVLAQQGYRYEVPTTTFNVPLEAPTSTINPGDDDYFVDLSDDNVTTTTTTEGRIVVTTGVPQVRPPDSTYGLPNFSPGEPLGPGGENETSSSNPTEDNCMNMDAERNRNLVEGFYRISLEEKRPDLLSMYLAEDYLNHSPFSEGRGRADFYRILTDRFANEPSQRVRFFRITTVDDIVWAHSSWNLNGTRYSVMDLWTVNCDGLLQEHWDVLQDINITTRNPVAFF